MNTHLQSFKKIVSAIILLLTLNTQAQAPQAFSFQTVVRNASGQLLTNTTVGIKISIYEGNTTEFLGVYSETHTVTSNVNGLVTLEIGMGTNQSGSISTINWNGGNIYGNQHYLKIEIDPTGGTNYTIISDHTRLVSVPTALHANTSGDNMWNVSGDRIYNKNTGFVGIGTSNPDAHLTIYENDGQAALNLHSANSSTFINLTSNDGNAKIQFFKDNVSNFRLGIDGFNNFFTIEKPNGYQLMTIRNDNNYFGINHSNPQYQLHVGNATNGLRVEGPTQSSSTAKTLSVGGYGSVGIDAPGIENGRFFIQENGNTSIGSNLLTSDKLFVNGKTRMLELQVQNGAATGKVLTSDANGNATWQNPSSPSVQSIAGVITYIAGGSGSYSFAGPTVQVIITSPNQKIVATANASLAMASGTSQTIHVGMCYQPVGGGSIENFAGGSYTAYQVTTTKSNYGASASITNLPVGTYNIGLGVLNAGTNPLNNNDYVNGWVMVLP